MMVMPAAYRVDLHRLSLALGGPLVEVAEEAEFRDAFPDCELGAMPPFGHLYGMPVYVDSRLAQQPEIAFNAGCRDAPYADFIARLRSIDAMVIQRGRTAPGDQGHRRAGRRGADRSRRGGRKKAGSQA